jgi:hypothetical protein
MMRRYPFPNGPIVDVNGRPSVPGRAYLEEIQRRTERANTVANLSSGTNYTADQLRDKLIELLSALQG